MKRPLPFPLQLPPNKPGHRKSNRGAGSKSGPGAAAARPQQTRAPRRVAPHTARGAFDIGANTGPMGQKPGAEKPQKAIREQKHEIARFVLVPVYHFG